MNTRLKFVPFLIVLVAMLVACASQATTSTVDTHTSTEGVIIAPHLGGPLSAFSEAYGAYQYFPPSRVSNDRHEVVPATWLYTSHDVYILVQLTSGLASWIDVIGPQAWSKAQTRAYCMRFVSTSAYHLDIYGQNAAVLMT